MSKENVKTLCKKAADAEKSDNAMKFSQAACNVANSMCAVASAANLAGKKD